MLAKFALGPDDVARPSPSLSPGERTRAGLALLSAKGVNCLILDEPTNHLDLEAIEELETALETYEGCLVVVTHDRRFLSRLNVTRTIEPVTIEALLPADWPAVLAIYEEGIDIGTFEELVPTWEEWDQGHLVWPRLVAREDGAVIGWAALAPYSDRACYRGVAENSIYIARERPRSRHRARPARPALRGLTPPGSGRSRPASWPRTRPRSRSTPPAGSGTSASARSSPASAASGATWC